MCAARKNVRSSDLEARLCFVFLPPRLSGASSFCTGLFHGPRLSAALEALSKRGIQLHLEQQRKKCQLTCRTSFWLVSSQAWSSCADNKQVQKERKKKSDKCLYIRTCSTTFSNNRLKVNGKWTDDSRNSKNTKWHFIIHKSTVQVNVKLECASCS